MIPYNCWNLCAKPADGSVAYENGFIVLLSPDEYFGSAGIEAELAKSGLTIGTNAAVFYEKRSDWNAHNPDALGWTEATSRTSPLGGQYVARVAATTAESEGDKINRGFTSRKPKGAGIRVYEYASADTISRCRLQLEALVWSCIDSEAVAIANGMTAETSAARRMAVLEICKEADLFDLERLKKLRLVDAAGRTICPLCLKDLSAQGFFNRMEQAEGRVVHDLTVTELNLFHIEEVRVGVLNHRPYNIGWGHHHCNVVVKDSGLDPTLKWMQHVVERNIAAGHLPCANKAN